MTTNIMTIEHPRWEEFAERLEGPEGCNFTAEYDEAGNYIDGSGRWQCKGGKDKTFATAILTDMGMDVEASLKYFEVNGGYCDCEILFNVDK
jgi:hypothetical protein